MSKLVVFFVGFLFLGACASTVKTNLASYSETQGLAKGQSVALVPADPQKAESLEFKSFRTLIEQKFRDAGYRITTPTAHPDLIAELDYQIMPARQQTTYYRQRPVFGPFGGFAYGYRTGPWRRHAYRSTYLGYSFPLGGDYEETRSSTSTYYDRTLSLIIRPREQTQRLYESRIEGRSTCGQVQPVMTVLIARMFSDFPAPAQSSQTLELPDEAC
jgi:hypothetical protein